MMPCLIPCSCCRQMSSVFLLHSIADPKAAAASSGQSDGSLSSNVAAAMQSVNAEAAAAGQDTSEALGLAPTKGQAPPADVDPSVRCLGFQGYDKEPETACPPAMPCMRPRPALWCMQQNAAGTGSIRACPHFTSTLSPGVGCAPQEVGRGGTSQPVLLGQCNLTYDSMSSPIQREFPSIQVGPACSKEDGGCNLRDAFTARSHPRKPN